MTRRWGQPEELERHRDARHARRQLEKQDQYLALLRRALRIATDLREPPPVLKELITAGEGLRARFAGLSGLIMPSRRRATPGASSSARDCLIFLDECGAHSANASDAFPVFTLAAVIVSKGEYDSILELSWRLWKATNLLSADVLVHEPDVRKREKGFAGDTGEDVVRSLGEFLAQANFQIVACAIDRPSFRGGMDAPDLDKTLPENMYLMAMDMLFERIVLLLDRDHRGGRAEVVAESRGAREDAVLQYEFARLHLDGTAYIGDAFFRARVLFAGTDITCLHPGITFLGKSRNSAGLQLADLVARPIAEKVADPTRTPERWPEARGKLCTGQETKHSILGLKVFPWDDKYEGLWKS